VWLSNIAADQRILVDVHFVLQEILFGKFLGLFLFLALTSGVQLSALMLRVLHGAGFLVPT
jgi:hypothetical protein